jgi:acyl-ACP thioesterase
MKVKGSELIHATEYRIPVYNVSVNGQTKFYTLCNILLESAASQALELGFGYEDMKKENTYWVLSRFHIKMKSYPRMGQLVKVETWPKGMNRLFFLRDYRIFLVSGEFLAAATSAWILIDGKTGRPRTMEGMGDLQYYAVDDLHAIKQVPLKLPAIARPDDRTNFTVRYSDLDIYKHVNAVKYVEWIQDVYPARLYENHNVEEFQINYQSETRYGEEVEIRIQNDGPEAGFHYFEGVRDHNSVTAFRAKIKFGEFI